MARDSRSRSPRRDRPRYASDGRRGPEEPRRDRTRKHREDDEGRNDRYRRRRYDEDDRGHRKGSDRRGRESSLEKDRRRGGYEKERESGGTRDGERDRRARENDDDRRPGPSNRDSRGPSPRPRSRSKSPASEEDKDKDKGKPNFKQSGLLAAETNSVRLTDGTSTVLKYNEPPEARKSPNDWRLYVFKGKEQTDLLHIHRQSCYLIGRDKAVVDIYIEHPSSSKQHAVIQYRQVQEKKEFGSSKAVVKPFIIDLESTNHTYVNDEEIPQSRYYELKMGDVIKFGMSTREYVILHDDA